MLSNIRRKFKQWWYGASAEETSGIEIQPRKVPEYEEDDDIEAQRGRDSSKLILNALASLPPYALTQAHEMALEQVTEFPVHHMDVLRAVDEEEFNHLHVNPKQRKVLRVGKLRKILSGWFDGISLSSAIAGSFAALLAFQGLNFSFWSLLGIMGVGCPVLFAAAAWLKVNNLKDKHKAQLLVFSSYNVALDISERLVDEELECLKLAVKEYNQLSSRYSEQHHEDLTIVVRNRYGKHFRLPFVPQEFAEQRWRRDTIFGDKLTVYETNVATVKSLSDKISPPFNDWESDQFKPLHKALHIDVSGTTTWYKFLEIRRVLGFFGMLGVTMAFWGGTSALKEAYDGDDTAWKNNQTLIIVGVSFLTLSIGHLLYNYYNDKRLKEGADLLADCKHGYGEEEMMISSLRDANRFMQMLLRFAQLLVPQEELQIDREERQNHIKQNEIRLG